MRRHGFTAARTYVAKVGRSRFVEVHFIVPSDRSDVGVVVQDRIRDELAQRLGGVARDRWLTVSFTADPRWAE